MSFFFGPLPADVQILILQSFIGRPDDGGMQMLGVLSDLDIACCNHGDRPAFLQLARHPLIKWPDHDNVTHFKNSYHGVINEGAACLAWLAARKVPLIILTAMRFERFPKKIAVVPSIKKVYAHLDVCVGLLTACPNVESIECHSAWALWKRLANYHNKVQRIVTTGEDKPKSQSVNDATCSFLERNTLKELKVNLRMNADLVDAFCKCTHLKVLEASGLTADDVLDILESCTNLEDLGLQAFDGTPEELGAVLKASS